jgi:hypothetical protein
MRKKIRSLLARVVRRQKALLMIRQRIRRLNSISKRVIFVEF